MAADGQVPAARSQQDFKVTLNFPEALQKGQPAEATFTYDGKLIGQEESPVYGIKFASIQKDHAFLMYPARWFPVNDYTVDRYTATAYHRSHRDIESSPAAWIRPRPATAASRSYTFKFTQPSFPGSIAVVQGTLCRVRRKASPPRMYFRDAKDMAQAYGEETGKVLTYLTSVFGLPPQSSLTLVETEPGTPNGYAAQGLIFLSPQRDRQASESAPAGEPDRPPVAGRTRFPRDTQSHVADQRRGAVCGTAVPGASERRRRPGE